jgi:hypothetical protein
MAQRGVITYPIPAYSNPPIEPQYYKPKVFDISAITLGYQTTVTTAVNHDYVIGQLVRLLIPSKYGSRLLNEVKGLVVLIPAVNQVTLDINSIGVDPFIASPTFLPYESHTLPQIVAIGDQNSGLINIYGRSPTQEFIDGSFINISPL